MRPPQFARLDVRTRSDGCVHAFLERSAGKLRESGRMKCDEARISLIKQCGSSRAGTGSSFIAVLPGTKHEPKRSTETIK